VTTNPLEPIARRIFEQAIKEQRCGDLMECLFNDGSATVDAVTGVLVLISADGINQLFGSKDA
jgi:hypothetical protein